mgnify:CR=1 FL=1
MFYSRFIMFRTQVTINGVTLLKGGDIVNKEIRIGVLDLCLSYGCALILTYAVGTIAYFAGNTKAKTDVANAIAAIAKGETHERRV